MLNGGSVTTQYFLVVSLRISRIMSEQSQLSNLFSSILFYSYRPTHLASSIKSVITAAHMIAALFLSLKNSQIK
jgi:hypothetical protein